MSDFQTQQAEKDNRPTHRAKVRHGHGKQATFEEIGVAWENTENDSFYIKLHGQQLVTDGFSLYRINRDQ